MYQIYRLVNGQKELLEEHPGPWHETQARIAELNAKLNGNVSAFKLKNGNTPARAPVIPVSSQQGLPIYVRYQNLNRVIEILEVSLMPIQGDSVDYVNS